MSEVEHETERLGFLESLSGSQNTDLIEVRARLDEMGKMEEVVRHGGDKFLLSFLRAEMSRSKSKRGKFNVEKSMKRIVSFLEWCEDFGFNVPFKELQEPKNIEEYNKCKPALAYLDPKAQTAVIIEKFGYTFSNIDTNRMSSREWEECFGYDGLRNRELLREADLKFGFEPTGTQVILDDKGLGWGFAARLKFVKFINGVLAERFPESVDKIYIVNAPKLFTALFSMIKPALHKDLVAKISFTSGIPTELLRERLDPSLLPVEYGGDNEEATVPMTCDYSKAK